MLAAAAGWGLARGARWMVLQVALQNAGARSLYGRLGMVEHHRYRYLVPPE
jgi:predicted GNAT family acetyltransferase